MTTGIALPVGVNTHGGVRLVMGDEQAQKIIGLALSDLDSDNAFQQGIGLGADLVFDPASPTFRAKVRQRLFNIFEEFERLKLFRLVRRSIRWTKAVEGEQTLEFAFINLETDLTVDFDKTFVAKAR